MDTCMTDMVLRRLVLAAKETGRPLADPAKDPRMLEETFLMLVTVCALLIPLVSLFEC